MAAYSSKSLEFNAGGSDVRVGIWARQNSIPYYQAWPQWSIHDLFLNFHAKAPASPANDFLKFQHYLLGRADRTQYNAAGVFPYPMLDPAQEDAYYSATIAKAQPAITNYTFKMADKGTSTGNLFAYRFYAWRAGGGGNQMDFRYSDMQDFRSEEHTSELQ